MVEVALTDLADALIIAAAVLGFFLGVLFANIIIDGNKRIKAVKKVISQLPPEWQIKYNKAKYEGDA